MSYEFPFKIDEDTRIYLGSGIFVERTPRPILKYLLTPEEYEAGEKIIESHKNKNRTPAEIVNSSGKPSLE